MDISLDVIQELAPDQASLNAAKKLIKPGKWPLLGKALSVNSIWGQCQGSGANPYYTMADVVDHGYKCTCPSRKFPCKHVLALMWQYSESEGDFGETEPPEWVNDWLGRRRKVNANSVDDSQPQKVKPALQKNIHTSQSDEIQTLSTEQQEKAEAAKLKRAATTKAKTDAAISLGLLEFQQWIADQLRTGVAGFIKQASDKCRRIAARLVDAKAGALASSVDELPALILDLTPQEQTDLVFKMFGQWVLLTEAWLANPDDLDARRAINMAEAREDILNNPNTVREKSVWMNVGEKIFTRRDGLVSHTTWLINSSAPKVSFAMLQDYYPASAGKREIGLGLGAAIEGEVLFYPSRFPIRGVIAEHKILTQSISPDWQPAEESLSTNFQRYMQALPWGDHMPFLLGAGRILRDSAQRYWWRGKDETTLLLKNHDIPKLLLGSELTWAFIVWNGLQAEIYSAHSEHWGVMAC